MLCMCWECRYCITASSYLANTKHTFNMHADYTVNQNRYVFTNETFTLPIRIQLLEDRSGEGIESFDLTLMLPQQSISADIVFPGSVTVVIIDDDCT